MAEFVLVDRIAKRDGRTTYFRFLSRIGPCGTSDLSEAARYPTAEAARQSPAAHHMLCAYEPEEVAPDA